MINLLPPEVKEQVGFSKMNRTLIAYLLYLLAISTLLLTVTGLGHFFANLSIKEESDKLAKLEREIGGYQQFQEEIKVLNTKLGLIEQIYKDEAEFSRLLQDIASVLPDGAYITNIGLTGDQKKPVELNVGISSLTQAAAVRNALEESERIANVDIVSASQSTASYVFSFEEGQAR